MVRDMPALFAVRGRSVTDLGIKKINMGIGRSAPIAMGIIKMRSIHVVIVMVREVRPVLKQSAVQNAREKEKLQF